MGNIQAVGATDTEAPEGVETTPDEDTTEDRPGQGTPETGAAADDAAGEAQADDAERDKAADDTGSSDNDDDEPGDEVQALTADRDKWRALARKNEDRAKANAAAAQALKDAETERDALKAESETHAARVGDLEAENTRLLAALKHGLADSDLRFLKGVPADEIDAAAADLAARVGRTSGGRERFLGRETPPGSGAGAGGDFLRQAMTARNI